MHIDFLKKHQHLFLLFLCFLLIFLPTYHFGCAPHIPLLTAIIFLSGVGMAKGHPWSTLEKTLYRGIREAIPAFLMMALIGMLGGVWMMSGSIPTMVYYGLHYLSPQWFYPSALLLSMALSTFCGSSVFSVVTLGSALMGIAEGMGCSLPITAGAIVSGSAFGDKCSPLSDTTQLAANIAGTSLNSHVRHLLRSALPSIALTLFFLIYLGRKNSMVAPNTLLPLQNAIEAHFTPSFFALIPPFLLLFFFFFVMPTLLNFSSTLLFSIFLGSILQKEYDLARWFDTLQRGYRLQSNDPLPSLALLVERGGLQPAMWGISLIALALTFGTLLKHLGMINYLLHPLRKHLKSPFSLIFATGLASLLVNALIGEQYLSIILPGKALKKKFDAAGIPTIYLSRTLEDFGTLSNPLFPWSICGALFAKHLGVSVLTYLPFATFLYLSPLFTLLFCLWMPPKKSKS